MADLHRAAFTEERSWSASEFQDLLESPHVTAFNNSYGFALSRTVAGESELLTLAVAPSHQGQGIGRALTQDWLDSLAGVAEVAFLEVAADNIAALALYRSLQFAESGLRKAYYTRAGAASADAIVMRRRLTFGQSPESTAQTPESG